MKLRLLIGTIALAMTCMPLLAESGHRGRSVSVTNRGDEPIDRCDQIHVTFDDVEAARSEEEIAVARSRDPLRVSVSENSGLWVQASDRRDSSIRACKAASSPEYLNRISLSFENGQFAARGPDEREWMVYLLVSVPRDAALDLEASNGPLSVRGSAGSVVVRTSNGPISVELSGRRWEGAGLVARAVNGPLSLKIPEDYQSGTVIEMSGRSPVSCRARACGQARRNWDEDSRRIEFGGAAPIVRLSTVNGPVSIKEVSERGN